MLADIEFMIDLLNITKSSIANMERLKRQLENLKDKMESRYYHLLESFKDDNGGMNKEAVEILQQLKNNSHQAKGEPKNE